MKRRRLAIAAPAIVALVTLAVLVLGNFEGATARASSTWYKQGYLNVCPTATGCSQGTSAWWAQINAGLTMDGTQIWRNWYQCWGTSVSWCGDSGNGTGAVTIGENFGNGGWLRITFWANGTWASSHPSWEVPAAYCYANGSSACFGKG